MPYIKKTEWDESDVRNFSNDQRLNTWMFYKYLETPTSSTHYDVYCGSYENPVHYNRDVRNICATILNYLEIIYSASDHKNDEYDGCKLLNYWVFSRLSEIYVSGNISTAKDAFSTLESIWNRFIKDKGRVLNIKNCKPDILLFSYTDWKKRKELYEYYADIYPISKSPESYKQVCDQYYKYLQYKKKIYDKYEKFCLNPYDENCPSFFETYKKYNPNDILTRLTCYNEMIKEEATKDHASPSSKENPTPGAHTRPLISAEVPDSPTSIGTKASNALLGVVATSMTSGALYKFTPLGRILRNRFGWNNNMRNLNGAENGLYDYASESYNPYSGGAEEHYIGYHPA